MSGQSYSAEETEYLRSLVRQSPDASTSEIARQFCSQFPRSLNGARCKAEEIRHEKVRDNSAEVQLWVARRAAAQKEMDTIQSPHAALRDRLAATPNSVSTSRSPVVEATQLMPCLCVSDAHIPYHSKAWWSLLMQVAREIKPQRIVIIGDFADCYSISDHDKAADRANRMPEELKVVDACLDELDALGATDKLYIEGNHEDRMRRLLMKVPQLTGLVSIPKLLKLQERGWEFVPYKRHAKRGAIHYTHDVNAAGRNAVFKALDTYQHSVVTGHTHRLQYIVEGSAVGDCKLSAMFGWGGDVEQVEYMCLARARKDWCLGFGVGYHDTASEFTYWVPVPVIHETCMVNGRLYRAA